MVSQHLLQSAISIGNVTHTVAAQGWGSESVSSLGMDVWGDPTAEGERGQRVVVCQKDYSMDQLCQRPAMLLCLQ